MPGTSKTCKVCRKEKPFSGFSKNPMGADGYRSDCKDCVNRSRNERRHKNPDKVRNEWMRLRLGISLEEYKKKMVEQKGVCAICEKPETSSFKGKIRNLSIDHDHSTGKVRGLLCNDCNVMLGWAHDDRETLLNAVKYLNMWLQNVS